MRCPDHPERLADRACSICGAWRCERCAPVHADLDDPVCPPCAAALLRRPPPPPPTHTGRRLIAIVGVAILALGIAWAASRPRPQQRAQRAWRALEHTGEALEAFAAREGRYPDDLAALVPRELPRLPPDPWAPQQPLRYVAPPGNPDGRILYSLGPDGLDQRGTPRDPITGDGDLVYPVR